ncbi:MAG: RNA polymerase factor sigma-54 [Moorellales bacterium]
MRLGIGVEMETAQRLVLTPELRQAIAVLELPSLELARYVEEALLENPLLELREEEPGETETAETRETEEEWLEYFADTSDLGLTNLAHSREVEPRADFPSADSPSLAEHLRSQLSLQPVSPRQRAIAEFLIGNLDHRGYLGIEINEAARCLSADPGEVEAALRLVQSLDPAGVGARDLKECLRLQLAQRPERNPLAEAIVEEYLEEVAAGRLGKIARRLGESVVEVQAAVDLIRSLDPKPGRRFGSTQETRYLHPDVVVEKVGGEYVVMVNDAVSPRLGLNSAYYSMLKEGQPCDPELRRFLEGRLTAAIWLIRSLEQRRLTLYRVSSFIVEYQREFLDKGLEYLRPLTLRQVAEGLGIHESTVSRATANKYLQTPRGLYEFRFFFAGRINTSHGPTAAPAVKKLLAEYVAAEDPRRPLTDRQLAELLRRQGICLARRTVAKYREELGIGAVNQRRRY